MEVHLVQDCAQPDSANPKSWRSLLFCGSIDLMDHIAIMKKAWGLTSKILSGQKKIESRWYKTRHPPWGQIRGGETVYFKDSGEPVTLKATVEKVLQFENLTPTKVRELLDQYGKDDGLGISDLEKFWQILRDKKYCLLIFLTKPQSIEPFAIDKRGFGNMAAWITTPDINHLKKTNRTHRHTDRYGKMYTFDNAKLTRSC